MPMPSPRWSGSEPARTRGAFPPAQTTRLTVELSFTATRGIDDGLCQLPAVETVSTRTPTVH
ncbi:hypothetical protein ARTHRO9V_100069 [Arthrobacter sp. 9V]|nr:hypothetical protein ARTHRO9V_100069 [Arthrobacter sp. 9V]